MHILEFFIAFIVLYGLYELIKQKQNIQASSKTSNKQYSNIEEEVTELKHRVAVLEKIVTDKNYDLKSQIDDL